MIDYRVIRDRETPFRNPMILNENDKVECGEEYKENENWPGWIWCNIENNGGWVPIQIIKRDGDSGIVLENYNGTEFDIQIDEIIVMEKKLNGWIWGYKKNNPSNKAWVPLDYLEII